MKECWVGIKNVFEYHLGIRIWTYESITKSDTLIETRIINFHTSDNQLIKKTQSVETQVK
jgi:hypothetical protein